MKTPSRTITLFAMLTYVSAPVTHAQDHDIKDAGKTPALTDARTKPVPIDLSTPRKTIETYYTAQAANDYETMAKCSWMEDPVSHEMMGLWMTNLALCRDLQAGLDEHFKTSKVAKPNAIYPFDMMGGAPRIAAQMLAEIKRAKDPVITGDKAVMDLSDPSATVGNEDKVLKFRRVAGEWKYEQEEGRPPEGSPPKSKQQQLLERKELEKQIVEARAHLIALKQAGNAFLKHLKAGKYKTREEAEETFEKFQAVAMGVASLEDMDLDGKRLAAVEKLTDQAALEKLAVEDKNEMVRAIAVSKLTNQALLAKLAGEDKDQRVRNAAEEQLKNLRSVP